MGVYVKIKPQAFKAGDEGGGPLVEASRESCEIEVVSRKTKKSKFEDAEKFEMKP